MENREYQAFVDFANILRPTYGYDIDGEKYKQGYFVFLLLQNISYTNDLRFKEDTFSRYLSESSIYKSDIIKSVRSAINKVRFAKWIEGEYVSREQLDNLVRAFRKFVEEHSGRFGRERKKELLELGKYETVGKFVAEIFVDILFAPDRYPSGPVAKPSDYSENDARLYFPNEVAENTRVIPNINYGVKKANAKLDKQSRILNGLKTAQGEVADGVFEANVKLDELLKLAPKFDRFDQFVDNQANAYMTVFVYNLLGDTIDKISPVYFDQMVQELKKEIDDALNKAILMRLPDAALAEIEKYMDNNPDDDRGMAEFILQKANECGLDLTAITIDTLTRVERLYRPGVQDLPDEYYEECQAEPPQTDSLETLLGKNIDDMSDDELVEWRGLTGI